MGENSGIAWTTHTFNPWVGCSKVSLGCEHCYAEAWDQRFSDGAHWGPGAPRRRTSVQNWDRVRRWNREAAATGMRPRVFCASLADVFDNEVPAEWREDLWQLIAETPHLDWIIVTKRVGIVEKMAPANGFPPNVIILSTIVNQDEADRDVPKLIGLKIRGTVSKIGISYEPALGTVDWGQLLPGLPPNAWLTWLDYLDWLIVGGESDQGGAKARPFHIAWAWSSIRQCQASGVAVFLKQLGSSCIMDRTDAVQAVALGAGWDTQSPGSELGLVRFLDRAGADLMEWPADLRVREFPVIGGGNA